MPITVGLWRLHDDLYALLYKARTERAIRASQHTFLLINTGVPTIAAVLFLFLLHAYAHRNSVLTDTAAQ